MLEPVAGRGGLARVATLVRELRGQSPHTLFVLAGDTLSPSLLSTLRQGAQMIEGWNAVGLDVATFGNHEFDFGAAVLAERVRESRFAWLSANVLDRATGQPFGGARRGRAWDFDGVRVGVIGLTTPEAARTSNPGPGLRFDEPLDGGPRRLRRAGAAGSARGGDPSAAPPGPGAGRRAGASTRSWAGTTTIPCSTRRAGR